MDLINITHPLPGYCLLELNQPDTRNALSHALVSRFKFILKDLAQDKSIKVLGITGSGNTFCSGADLGMLKEMQKNSYEENISDSKSLAELFQQLWHFPLPTIGLVNGSVMAGGLGLLTTLDYAIGIDDEKSKFGFSEVKIGFLPAIIANFLIRKLPGYRARWLMISGDIFGINEAIDFGLIHEKVPMEQLKLRGIEVAKKLIINNSRDAMILTKKLINEITEQSLSEGINYTILKNAEARQTKGCQHGIDSFLKKSDPDWQSFENS